MAPLPEGRTVCFFGFNGAAEQPMCRRDKQETISFLKGFIRLSDTAAKTDMKRRVPCIFMRAAKKFHSFSV